MTKGFLIGLVIGLIFTSVYYAPYTHVLKLNAKTEGFKEGCRQGSTDTFLDIVCTSCVAEGSTAARQCESLRILRPEYEQECPR